MLVSYRWLRKLAHIATPVEQLAERLTMAGLEVEAVRDFGFLSGRMVAGRIESVEKLAHSDRLTVCKVNAGARGLLSVVCGAPNVRARLNALLALEGAELTGGRTIHCAEIHGVESSAMLCSAAEVGWSADAAGILELPDDIAPGEPFDCLFDIKPTPNRPDCLSVFGVARDIVGLEGRELYAPQVRMRETMDRVDAYAQVTIRDKQACPRYTCRLARNARVDESPVWLKRALESAGLRPLNNIVDVTNYVLAEYGHPLHAFDLDKVAGKRIIVRMAEAGEKIKLLDGRTLDLTPQDLVIADADRPIALAGVMGGANTEITDATINVLIESAYFDPATVRATAKRHGLSTDASYRFERGADIKQLIPSLSRATQLMGEVSDAEIVKGVLDIGKVPPPAAPITMSVPRACMILGCDLSPTAIADKLVHIGFETVRSDREQLVMRPPSYRVDVSRDVDLIEEIARVHGYGNISETTPYLPARPFRPSPVRLVRQALRRALTAAGLTEVINYSFVGRELLEKCHAPLEGCVEILNPLSQDQAVLRTALTPSLLANIQTNQRRGSLDARFFELGKSYAAAKKKNGDAPYVETETLGLALVGQNPDRGWRGSAGQADLFDLKGIVETALADLGIGPLAAVRLSPAASAAVSALHPGRSLALIAATNGGHVAQSAAAAATTDADAAVAADDERIVAILGEIHPNVAEAMELRGRACVAEMVIERLVALASFTRSFKPLPRYPRIDRDIALIVDQGAAAARLEAAIAQTAGPLLESLRLFDVYEGERLGAGKRSLAYALSFRAPDRTLRDEEVDEIQRAVTDRLAQEFGAVLRSE